MQERAIRAVVLSKWSDYSAALPGATVRFLDRGPYLAAARDDPQVRDAVELGWFDDFESEFREPVLGDAEREVVTVCSSLMREIVEPEPPTIQRAFVEGAFLRRLFRLCVTTRGWAADAQIRLVMARHFPFQLAAVEALETIGPAGGPASPAGDDEDGG